MVAVTATRRSDSSSQSCRPPASARNALHTYIARLRRLLGANLDVHTRSSGYSIEIDPGCVDVAEFSRLVAEARTQRTCVTAPENTPRSPGLSSSGAVPLVANSSLETVLEDFRPALRMRSSEPAVSARRTRRHSLFVLRHRGILEQRLPDVEWVDLRTLPAKPPVDPKNALPTLHFDWLFEEGGYDFIGTGFTPPVTGLAHGRDLVYVGISGPRVENGRLVVKAGTSVADLRGHRVGIAHGSWRTTLLLFALNQARLSWSDIEPVDTAVHDGPAPFLSGDLEAWVGAYPRARPPVAVVHPP
jgi:hypothetical protein